MSQEEKTGGPYPRKAGDFLTSGTAAKAGIIEVRYGGREPVPYGPSYVWPSSPAVTALEYDSRNVAPGALYFALPGIHADGHSFIDAAVDRGAVAVVHGKDLAGYRQGVLYIKVKDPRFAMSPVADAYNGFPSRRMGVIGVTGTEGKSTTVYLIYQLLSLLGKKAGFISTVQRGDGVREIWNSEHQTTPEAVTIHSLLAGMSRNGAEYAVLESSSHGLSRKTNRLGDVDFDAAVMTNVTHEHLEFHGTWEQYRSDKAGLFRSLNDSPTAHRKQGPAGDIIVPSYGVINADDPSAGFFAAAAGRETYTFSVKGADADLSVTGGNVRGGSGGSSYAVFERQTGETFTLSDKLPGAFNAGNVLAALLTAAKLLSVEIRDLAPLVPRLKPVRGRMTAVTRGQPFEVLVDYAHTPSSFGAVLPPLRQRLDASGGRLICLFGSPGERDTQKRRLQGEVAARYCNAIVLADEDPRGEDPLAILEEIAVGCEAASGCGTDPGRGGMTRGVNLFLIPDRPRAVRKAISLAREGDVVLLLGKGHENSIIYAAGAIAYDEIAEAEKALEEAGYGPGETRP